MRCLRYLPLPSLLWAMLAAPSVHAAPWKEDPVFFSENANAPSSKVDAADLDGDKLIDLVFANGAGYNKGDPDSPQFQQAFRNNGTGMEDISANVFMGTKYAGRAVKLRDLDNDGDNDIFLGTTWFTTSQLFLNNGDGSFPIPDPTRLPAAKISVGDVEVGDVDQDGDLDIVLANWGDDPLIDGEVDGVGAGGVTLLWTQAGEPGEVTYAATSGMFSDTTGASMPNIEVQFSWDLDFIDLDNDYDLDLAISTKDPNRSLLVFENNGTGSFQSVSVDNVQGKASVEVEPWDINGDDFLDLVTLQDGQNRRNRVLTNDANGGFLVDPNIWSQLQNPSSFDFSAAFVDHDKDGDADLALGTLHGGIKLPDRLMVNENGLLAQYDTGQPAPLQYQALEHENPTDQSAGTYSIVLADFNADTKLDIAMAQNENAFDKKVFLAQDEVLADTLGPVFVNYQDLPDPFLSGTSIVTRARVHDNKSPLMLHDFQQTDGYPYLETWTEQPSDPPIEPSEISQGQWYGEYLWRIPFTFPVIQELWWRLCAIDAAGNKVCTPVKKTSCDPADENCFPVDPTTGTTIDTLTDPSTTTTSDSETDPTLSTLSETDSESTSDTLNTDSDTENVPTTDGITSLSTTDSETNTITDPGLDDDGCGCATSDAPARGVLASFALLGLLGIRRRRR